MFGIIFIHSGLSQVGQVVSRFFSPPPIPPSRQLVFNLEFHHYSKLQDQHTGFSDKLLYMSKDKNFAIKIFKVA